jgi:hypothetical protein
MPVCTAWPHCPLPIQLTSSPPMYGQNPYRCHRHASPCRCPPSLRSMPARVLALSEHGRALRAMPCCPNTPSACTYKRRPYMLHLVRAIDLLSSPVSRTPPPLFSIVAATVDNAAQCLSVSLRRSRSFVELQSFSLSHWTPTFLVGAPPHRRCAGELPLQRHPSSSVCFQGRHLAAPWPMDTPRKNLPADHPAAGHLHPHRALHVVWAVTWAVHVLRYGPRRARPRSIVTRARRPHTLRVHSSRAGFGPWTIF